MKRVRFYLNSGYVGAKREETMEYDDDTTDQEIQRDFEGWIDEYAGWYELEDEE